jgi:hypothetical protein
VILEATANAVASFPSPPQQPRIRSMKWYQVTKTIKGRRYLYWQRTERHGKQVKTFNKYIGPTGSGRNVPASSSIAATPSTLDQEMHNFNLRQMRRAALYSLDIDDPTYWDLFFKHNSHLNDQCKIEIYNTLKTEADKLYAKGNALPWDHPDKHSSIDRYHKAFDVISQFQEQTIGRPIDQWGSPKGSGGGQLNRRDFEKELPGSPRPSTAKVTPQPDISAMAPRTPEEAIYQLTPSTTHLSGRDKRDYERERKKRRMEDERIQYGLLKARLKRQREKFLSAKRKTRGIKALNPFIAQALRSRKK